MIWAILFKIIQINQVLIKKFQKYNLKKKNKFEKLKKKIYYFKNIFFQVFNLFMQHSFLIFYIVIAPRCMYIYNILNKKELQNMQSKF